MKHRYQVITFALLAMAMGWIEPNAIGNQPTGSLDQRTPESNLSVQLENCRQGLSDPQVRPEDRKRWAQLLFTLDVPPARALVIEILSTAQPSAQLAICETIAERGRVDPNIFDSAWIPLLMARMRSDDRALRMAAASAVGVHNSEELAKQLGDLAASETAPLVARLAAVEALAQHIDRRSHVRQLIRLTELAEDSIANEVYAALEPTARRPFGKNADLWKEWWKQKESLSEEAWLLDRVDLYGDRLAVVQHELELAREDHKRQMDSMRIHVVELQREVHRMSSPEERNARLVQWLASPLSDVRLTALSIIQARIADDGRPPEGPLRDAIFPLLHDTSVAVRRQTVLIVQNLNDPLIAGALLEQLKQETDPGTRATILKALGRLNVPEAIPVLVGEIENTKTEPACLREAVLALGEIAGKLEDPVARARIARTLQERYRLVSTEETPLRAALLVALAAGGSPEYKAEFEEALNSTNPEILRPAIRGAKNLRLISANPRLRTLSSDADPLIRSAALDALGQLGTDDADIESLLVRLNPTIEANEDVREAAWRAFRELVKRRPVPNQFALAQRLPDSTDLPLRFLEQFTIGLEGQPENEATLDAAFERLAQLLSARKRHVEASACLKKLYDLRIKHPNGKSTEAALLWLSAVLNSQRDTDAAATIALLSLAGAERIPPERIMETVRQYFETSANDADQLPPPKLVAALKEQTPENPPPFWPELVKYLENRSREGSAKARELTPPAG